MAGLQIGYLLNNCQIDRIQYLNEQQYQVVGVLPPCFRFPVAIQNFGEALGY